MVVDPDYADSKEAGHVGGVGGSVFEQRARKTSWLDLRDLELQYEEGRRDSEDTIAERLSAASAHRASFPRVSLFHRRRAVYATGEDTIPVSSEWLGSGFYYKHESYRRFCRYLHSF